ncbi:MAG TPA: TylF/MycF/NovP-related O-methyltransferase [Pirellulales bacterium]|nr:TylF/MycF/NovP-related O-methyltransferase [Pirellulales bacterium]
MSATSPYEGSYLNYQDQCLSDSLFADSVAKIALAWSGKSRVRLAFAGTDRLLPIAYSFAEFGYEIVGFFDGENRTGLHAHQPLEALEPGAIDVMFVSPERNLQRAIVRRCEGAPVLVVPLTEIVDAHRRTLQSVNRTYFATCLDPRKLSIVAIVNALAPVGNFVECGVYLGGGSIYVARHSDEVGKSRKVFALDTFEGMPPPVEKDGDTPFQAGLFSDNHFDRVKQNYAIHNVLDRIEMHKGLVQDTLPGLGLKGDVALALLDTDQYAGTRAGLSQILPNLSADGVVIVDDADGAGVSAAIDEALAATPGFRRLKIIPGFDLVVSTTATALRLAA